MTAVRPIVNVLGAGLVGGTMAADLAAHFNVRVADRDQGALDRLAGIPNVKTHKADLTDPAAVARLTQGADCVISAVPGRFGTQVLRSIIEGRGTSRVVDIAFSEEDPRDLDGLARKHGVTVVPDMGVAPGMCHALVGYGHQLLGMKASSAEILVAGLPKNRHRPYQYALVFSLEDALDEYMRGARYLRNGEIVTHEDPLQGTIPVDFPGVGQLEGFLSDGLRTLLNSLSIPSIVERTLRYPGHIDEMRAMKAAGDFDKTLVDAGGGNMRTRVSITAEKLEPELRLKSGEKDITIMRVSVTGQLDGQEVTFAWDLYDEHDGTNHSMARTTGYSATMAARMLLQGGFDIGPGVVLPEILGANHPAAIDFMLRGLATRGVVYKPTGPGLG